MRLWNLYIWYSSGTVLYALKIELEWSVNILEELSANILFLLWLHKSTEEQVWKLYSSFSDKLLKNTEVNSNNFDVRQFSKAPPKMLVFWVLL